MFLFAALFALSNTKVFSSLNARAASASIAMRTDVASSSTFTARMIPSPLYVIRYLLVGTRWTEADLRRLELIT